MKPIPVLPGFSYWTVDPIRIFIEVKPMSLCANTAGVMLRILEDGVKDGNFRDDIDMRLVRDMIFGALDFEDLSFLVTGETVDASSDLEDIMALVLPMIRKRQSWNYQPMDKANRILLAAEKTFAEKGFNKAKVADVARLAEVAEGTVYEYLRIKKDLLLSIPGKRFQTIWINWTKPFKPERRSESYGD